MIKTIKLLLLSLSLMMTFSLMVQAEDKKPVDEGNKNNPKTDRIKGAKDINNTFVYEVKSLSKVKKHIYIKRQNINHAPFKCLHLEAKNNKITELFVEKRSKNSINFKIDASILKENDSIIIINDKDSNENSTGKEAIIQVRFSK